MLKVIQGFTYNKFQKPNDWPKIEDTFDYKYDNGKLIDGNKNLFLSGAYTVIGNPTIVDGVVSGFSASDYLTITNFTDFSMPFKIQLKFQPSNNVSADQNILSIRMSSGTFILGIEGNQWNVWYPNSGGGSTQKRVYGGFQTNHYYYFVAEFNNIELKIYGGEELENLNLLFVITDYRGSANTVFNLGVSRVASAIFYGSIDLNETYVKINDQPWFGKNYTTKNMVPVPKGLEYNNTIAPSNGWVYTTSDLIKGPANYMVVGSPTILDDVVSGFSKSNYLQLTFNPSQPFEMVSKFKVSSLGTRMAFYGVNTWGVLLLRVGATGKLEFYLGTNTNSFNIGTILSDFSISSNTDYWAKLVFTGSQYIASYSTDGTNYTQIDVINSTSLIANGNKITLLIGNSPSADTFNGFIDLNQTYIKMNGQSWFGTVSMFQEFIPAIDGTQIGKDDTHNLIVETPIVNDELLSPKIVGPVEYTVVGSPTIVDGVVSGFNYNDYLRLNGVIDFTKSFELFTKVFIDTSGWNPFIRFKNYYTISAARTQCRFYTGTSAPVTIEGFELNSYYCKFSWDVNTSTVTLAVSPDKITWYENSGTFTPGSGYENLVIGSNIDEGYFNGGSIDLNETYIKVNGALWFGKEDWTPCTYTDNAIYLLGSHSTDYSNYNTQGINATIETESDESGTYNVWIDNQKIYKEQSNPLDINWNNLALTTGYDITTPSTLKAHVIKVEPNNGNITKFSTTIEEDSDESI